MNEDTQRALAELIKAVEKQYGPIDYVTMCQPFEESAYFKRIVAGTPAPRKRSSRRAMVQRKRHRLGLDTWGIDPFLAQIGSKKFQKRRDHLRFVSGGQTGPVRTPHFPGCGCDEIGADYVNN